MASSWPVSLKPREYRSFLCRLPEISSIALNSKFFFNIYFEEELESDIVSAILTKDEFRARINFKPNSK